MRKFKVSLIFVYLGILFSSGCGPVDDSAENSNLKKRIALKFNWKKNISEDKEKTEDGDAEIIDNWKNDYDDTELAKLADQFHPWNRMITGGKGNDKYERTKKSIINQAKEIIGKGVFKRIEKLEDYGQYRSYISGGKEKIDELKAEFSEEYIWPIVRAELDVNATRQISVELPVVATAFVLTNERKFKSFLVKQFSTMRDWYPLQRSGWNAKNLAKQGIAPSDLDGSWLATGYGIRAITETLEIISDNSVHMGLIVILKRLLKKEVFNMVDDWRSQRQKFIVDKDVNSLEWALYNEGLIRASLYLGLNNFNHAYLLGVNNLKLSLDANGEKGEMVNGLSTKNNYLISILNASRVMALNKDFRAVDHSFFKNVGFWVLNQLDPVNLNSELNRDKMYGGSQMLLNDLTFIAAVTGNQNVVWALQNRLENNSDTIHKLFFQNLPIVDKEYLPPLNLKYSSSTMLAWKNSWDNDATSVWVTGGTDSVGLIKQIRGHINYVYKGIPILISSKVISELNLKEKDKINLADYYNVLQLEDEIPLLGKTHLIVRKNSPKELEARINSTLCYESLDHWYRDIFWSKTEFKVVDDVSLKLGKRKSIRFYWNLATQSEVKIKKVDRNYVISWPQADMELQFSRPIAISQELRKTKSGYQNTCLIIDVTDKSPTFRLKTRIIAKDPEKE